MIQWPLRLRGQNGSWVAHWQWSQRLAVGLPHLSLRLWQQTVLLLLASGASPAFLSGFVILFGGAAGTISILRPLRAREVLGEQNFGTKSGALALPFLLGSAAAPYLGSVIWAIGGYDLMLMLLAVLCGVGCLLYLLANHFSKGGTS